MTYREAYTRAKKILKDAGIVEFIHDASAIFEHCFGISKKDFSLFSLQNAPEEDTRNFFEFIKKRKDHKPLQYILGYCFFMENKYLVGKGVLIPRYDTEVLVKKCIDFIRKINKSDEKINILDLCSGTGAVAISLAKVFLRSKVVAVELYEKPYEYLKRNIEINNALNVEPLNWDVLSENLPNNISKNFNIIASNPPYIRNSEIPLLQKEVQNEPLNALDGGNDGLHFYRKILKNWKNFLLPGGAICVEIGHNQGTDVANLFAINGFKNIEIIKDFNNLDRVVLGNL